MEINFDIFKQPKVIITTIATIVGGIIATYEGYIKLSESMNETAKKKLEHYTLPIVKKEIKTTVDSIFTSRQVSFRSTLASEFEIKEEDVAKFIADWYKSEAASIRIGLYVNRETKKLYYIHTDGKEYRCFLDNQSDSYYFINDRDESEWCR